MIIDVRSAVAAGLDVLRFLLLALAALVLAHDAVYVQSHGPEAATALDALGHAGHRPYLVVAAASAVTALIVWSSIRLATLALRLQGKGRMDRGHRTPAVRRAVAATPGYRVTFGRLWVLLALVVVPAFFVQENLEHQAAIGYFPGLGVFTGQHAGALPTLLAVIGLISAIGALVRWQIARFTQRLTAGTSPAWRAHLLAAPPPRARTIEALLVRHRWLLARRTLGRAPPLAAA